MLQIGKPPAKMNVPLTSSTTLSTHALAELATSGALNEIANSPGSIKHHIQRDGQVEDGRVSRPLFFAVYQTGRYGPQNGVKLCLVHQHFEPDSYDFSGLEREIASGTVEYVVLGTAGPPIRDP